MDPPQDDPAFELLKNVIRTEVEELKQTVVHELSSLFKKAIKDKMKEMKEDITKHLQEEMAKFKSLNDDLQKKVECANVQSASDILPIGQASTSKYLANDEDDPRTFKTLKEKMQQELTEFKTKLAAEIQDSLHGESQKKINLGDKVKCRKQTTKRQAPTPKYLTDDEDDESSADGVNYSDVEENLWGKNFKSSKCPKKTKDEEDDDDDSLEAPKRRGRKKGSKNTTLSKAELRKALDRAKGIAKK